MHFPDISAGVLSSAQYVHGTNCNLLEIWHTFLQRLRSNDAIGALDLIYEPSRSKYMGVYNDLQADMPVIVDALGTAELSAFGDTLGELLVTRNNDGFPEAYMIYLIRTPYGTWQIEGMLLWGSNMFFRAGMICGTVMRGSSGY